MLSFCLRKVYPHRLSTKSAALSQEALKRIYLEGHGDLVSRLIIRITRVTTWVFGVMNLLTKSPDPPSRV